MVWILHSIFPAFMNGCRSLGNHLYVDVDQQTRDMLLALRAGHQVGHGCVADMIGLSNDPIGRLLWMFD